MRRVTNRENRVSALRLRVWVCAHKRSVVAGSIVVVLCGLATVNPDAATGRVLPHTPSSVREVQQRLAELKFLSASQVDGKRGPRTGHAITAFQQWSGLTADGIAGPRTWAKLRTADVPRPGDHGPSRRLEVHRAEGVTLLIEHGKVKRVLHSSAGKHGYATPTGSYRIVRKMLTDWSRPYKTWMPYALYFHRGYALHEGAVPTYPASHGCVRLPPGDAAAVYRFATIGTSVIIR